MNYKIDNETMKYLQLFLNRVPLKGNEVSLFVKVLNCLAQPQEEDSDKIK